MEALRREQGNAEFQPRQVRVDRRKPWEGRRPEAQEGESRPRGEHEHAQQPGTSRGLRKTFDSPPAGGCWIRLALTVRGISADMGWPPLLQTICPATPTGITAPFLWMSRSSLREPSVTDGRVTSWHMAKGRSPLEPASTLHAHARRSPLRRLVLPEGTHFSPDPL